MDSLRFKNKSVIITGGGSGIGKAAALCFAREGANVAICGRNTNVIKASGDLKMRYPGQKFIPFVGDASDEGDVIRLVKDALSKFGKIDILVNCAGVSEGGRVEDITLQNWCYVIENNLTNCFLTCKHVLPHMKKRRHGKIVNVSSVAGRFRSTLAGAHYTSAKAAVIAFTRQLAFEAARHNINVNAICPSQTDTPMLRKFLTPEKRRGLEESIPLGYIASPKQQAKVILFLASEDSDYMTGAIVDVNGGLL